MGQAERFVSKRISNLVQSDIRAMTRECNRVGGINMGQGLCELPTPEPVIQGAVRALQTKSQNVYSVPEGVLELRQAIATKLQRDNHIKANPETEIVVAIGATGGYAATLMALFNPGDGILLFEPYYGYHVNAALLAELEPQYVAMSHPHEKITAEAVRRAVRSNTKAIVICTPSNPSGKMFTRDEIAAIGQVAQEKDLLLITDEMYEYFRYDGVEHVSPMSLPELRDRTVTMMGMSKTYSITGWRLGYVVANEELTNRIRLANDLFYVCAPSPLQYGVVEGFKLPPSYFKEMQQDFKRRRDQFCSALEKGGMTPLVPQGAYYVLADISKWQMASSKEAAMKLLAATGIASVPGRAFFNSKTGENYLRFCFSITQDKLDEASRRIAGLKGGL